MKRESKFLLTILIGFGGLLPALGCDDSDPTLGQLSGSVEYQNSGLTGGMLEFVGAREDGSEFMRHASIEEDGSYHLKDLPTGSYRISVSTELLEGLPNYIAIPQELGNSKTSGLVHSVKPGKQNHLILIE